MAFTSMSTASLTTFVMAAIMQYLKPAISQTCTLRSGLFYLRLGVYIYI